MSDDDQLVADYLRRLRVAASTLPADRRDELVAEIAAHIAEARATGPVHAEASPTYVRNVLERLGEPDDIVNAAAEPGGGGEGTYEPAGTGGTAAPGETGRTSGAGAGGHVPGAPGPGGSGPGGAGPGGSAPGREGPAGYSPGGYGYGCGGAGGFGGGSTAAAASGHTGLGPMEITAVVLLLIGGFLAGIGWIVGVILLWASPRWRTADKWLGTLVWPGGLVVPVVALAVFGAIGLAHTSPCVNRVSGGALHGLGGRATVGENVEISSPLGRISVDGGNVDISGPGGEVTTRGGQATVTGPGGQVSSAGNSVSRHAAVGPSCSSAHPILPWLVVTLIIALLIVSVGGPILVAIWLLRRARRAPAQPTPEPAQLQPV